MIARPPRLGVVLLAFSIATGCGGAKPGEPVAAGAGRGFNVLLITIDTLRADRLGSYGSVLGLTPTLDGLAREGARFAIARAHVPLTLPSHATILTGRIPPHTGMHDNGVARLDASVPTLATALKASGYRTAAFVGAFVLDARFGLNRGFDVYDDRMLGNSATLDVVQRTAEQVLSPAAEWILTGNVADPWFAWVHLYDPHEPYAPPEPYRSRYASDPYGGEIAYADAAIGSLLSRLRSARALERTIVVVTSDHGESLGEHGEQTHGLFAYESTLRVPLILWGAAVKPAVVTASARLVDVMPSVLDLVGAPLPPEMNGRTLLPAIGSRRADAAEPPSYFEALNASLTRNWAPLKGVIANHYKLIDLPLPELYDLGTDPEETRNLYATQRERAKTLETLLDRTGTGTVAPGPATPLDADAEARLRSLGYVVASAARPARRYTADDDPKRLIHLHVALDRAVAEWTTGARAQAIETLRGVIRERPDLTVAYDRMAFMLRASGRADEAVALLDEAARKGHADATLLRTLGALQRDAGNLARSAQILEPLAKDGTDPQAVDALAQTYATMGRASDAEALFRRVLAASPSAATTWTNLGALFLSAKRDSEAIDALSRAIAINPALAGAHNALGVAFIRRGDRARAIAEWEEALRVRPDFEDARANLARVGAR